MEESRVWALGADRPVAAEPLTLTRLAELPHLVIAATGEDEHAIDGYVVDHGLERLVTRSDAGILQGVLAAQGLRRTVAMTTPHFLAALAIVSQSDIAVLLPRRLAEAFSDRYRLKLFDPPYTSPPFEVTSIWHRDHGNQPAVSWLRALVREVAAEL
jgi:DNA-binding transcriptional LysR family regulator